VKEKPVEELPPQWLDEAEYRAVVRHLDKEVNRIKMSAYMNNTRIKLFITLNICLGIESQ